MSRYEDYLKNRRVLRHPAGSDGETVKPKPKAKKKPAKKKD